MVVTKGRGKMAQQRPLTVFKIEAPCFNFALGVRNSVHICIMPGRTEKPLGATPQTQQEVGHFELIFQNKVIFGHFHTSYLIELIQQISSD